VAGAAVIYNNDKLDVRCKQVDVYLLTFTTPFNLAKVFLVWDIPLFWTV